MNRIRHPNHYSVRKFYKNLRNSNYEEALQKFKDVIFLIRKSPFEEIKKMSYECLYRTIYTINCAVSVIDKGVELKKFHKEVSQFVKEQLKYECYGKTLIVRDVLLYHLHQNLELKLHIDALLSKRKNMPNSLLGMCVNAIELNNISLENTNISEDFYQQIKKRAKRMEFE